MDSNRAEISFAVDVPPGGKLELPPTVIDQIGPGRWQVTISADDDKRKPPVSRGHTAFLNSYAPEDEGLYDDCAAG